MYQAISKMKISRRLDELVSKTHGRKKLWKKRLESFSVNEGTLFWKNLKVPTVEDLYGVLEPVHIVGSRHVRDY